MPNDDVIAIYIILDIWEQEAANGRITMQEMEQVDMAVEQVANTWAMHCLALLMAGFVHKTSMGCVREAVIKILTTLMMYVWLLLTRKLSALGHTKEWLHICMDLSI